MSTKRLKRKKKVKIEIHKLKHKMQKLVNYIDSYGMNEGKLTNFRMNDLEMVIDRIKELKGVPDPKAEEYMNLHIIKTVDNL